MIPKRRFRKPAARSVVFARASSARDLIGSLERNTDTFVLSLGQFSLIDSMAEVLAQTGPADVDIVTWTAANAHMIRAKDIIDQGLIRKIRWIVDFSFESRQPLYSYNMKLFFGTASVRTIRSHAKFIVIRNDSWNVVIRSSMNFNDNPRLEYVEVSEDRALADFLTQAVDAIFSEVEENVRLSDLPLFEGLKETTKLTEVQGDIIEGLGEVATTHVVGRTSR